MMQTVRIRLRVHRKDISYLRSTVESYDGMAMVKTIDPWEATIEVHISPGCEDLVTRLLTSLAEKEGLEITRVREPDPGFSVDGK